MKNAVGAAKSNTNSTKAIIATIFLSFCLPILRWEQSEPTHKTIDVSQDLAGCRHH